MNLAEILQNHHTRSTCKQLDCQELATGEAHIVTQLEDGTVANYTMSAQDVATVKQRQEERDRNR